MMIITTVTGKRIRLRHKKPGPKLILKGAKKDKLIFVFFLIGMKWVKKKQPRESYHFPHF